MLGQNSEPNRIVGGPAHLQRGYDPADYSVVRESVSLGQPAGNAGADQTLLQVPPQPMGPVQHGDVPPPATVLGLVSPQILDQPGDFVLIAIEPLHLHVES